MQSLDGSSVALANQATEEFRRAVDVLGRVGLTQYEARAYIALVARGLGDATAVAQSAGIPRTSAYKVLESLAEKGYAKATGGKPILFRPTPPLDVAETLKVAIQEVFQSLAELHREVGEHGEPQLVYLLSGREKVLAKISDLLDQSSRAFILTTPRLAEIRDDLEKKIQHAIKRGVHVTFVTAPLQKVPEGIQYVTRENLMATEVLADGQHALLAAPGLEACGFTDNPILIAHLQQFLELLLDRESETPSSP